MSNKQSSVEWFAERIKSDKIFSFEKVLEQAKEMHKEEVICSQLDMFVYLNNLRYGIDYLSKRDSAENFAEQYYNETFEGGNK